MRCTSGSLPKAPDGIANRCDESGDRPCHAGTERCSKAEGPAAHGHDQALHGPTAHHLRKADDLRKRQGMGRPRAEAILAPDETGQGKLDDLTRADADGSVDDDDARVGRNRQQVIDVQLADSADADIVRKILAEDGGRGQGGAIVASVGRAADEHLDGDGRRRTGGPIGSDAPRGGARGNSECHGMFSTLRSRQWVAQLIHGS